MIDWDLTQYPVFEFLSFLLAHGCLLTNDKILVTNYQRVLDGKMFEDVGTKLIDNMRKYAEFFADFCAQENDLMGKDAHFLACAIIAFTRKHLNLAVVWPIEMELLCMCKLASIK